MPLEYAAGISGNSPLKQQNYRTILTAQMHMVLAMMRRHTWICPRYLHIDLNAGPGQYSDGMLGSPLIAADICQQLSIAFSSWCIEKEAATYAHLLQGFQARYPEKHASLFTVSEHARFRLVHDDAAHALSCLMHVIEGHPRWNNLNAIYGMIYTDHNGLPNFPLLAQCAEWFARVDILMHVPATVIKRCFYSPANQLDKRLNDLMNGIKKDYWLVREPHNHFQWTFVLGTNWDDFPEFAKIGLYRTDSQRGRSILKKLSLNAKDYAASALDVSQMYSTPPQPLVPYTSYAEYLGHPTFLKVRAQVVERAHGHCEYQGCGEPMAEVHHLKYPPWGTFDVPENIIAICHQCHCLIHGKLS